MPVMTGSQLLAETLKGYGIDHVFFVPGIAYRALADMEELGITRVLNHSEIGAAYMADGYARAARKPGVCMGQAVGAANLAAGLRDAYLAGSPVIAIAGGPDPGSRYRHSYQLIEDFTMFDPVTKFNARVERLERFPDLLRQAFRSATTGTPAPVHLELSRRGGQVIEGNADLELALEEQFGSYPAYRPEPDMGAVQEAARILAEAERPVIMAGGGVATSDAASELVALAERLSIPVVTSLNGKGSIPDDHPLSVGVVGRYSRMCANQLVLEADLVFFVGSRAGGATTMDCKVPRQGTTVIQLDIDPEEIGRNYPVRVALVGDVRVTLQRLVEVAAQAPERTAWVERAQQLLRQWRAEMAPTVNSEAVPIRPERLCREITEALPPEAVVVADTGHAAHWGAMFIELKSPNQRYIRCAGTLGWAFPGSLGVKCALPDRPVLCFIGDGGFDYHSAELETALRMGLNTVTVVNNNYALSHPKRNVDEAYGGPNRGRSHETWRYGHTNFAVLAEARGCLGIRVERPGELRAALERGFAADRPVVIDVVTDVDAIAMPA